MRTAPTVAFSLCCLAGTVFAQTAPSPTAPQASEAAPATAGKKARGGDAAEKAPASPDSDGTQEKDAYVSCLEIWDSATHMSRREWDRACRRVAQRLKDMAIR